MPNNLSLVVRPGDVLEAIEGVGERRVTEREGRIGTNLRGWKVRENWSYSQVTKAEDGPQGLPG